MSTGTVRGLVSAGVSRDEAVQAFPELDALPLWSVWSWWWWPLEPAAPSTLVGHCVIGATMCSLFLDAPARGSAVWMSTVTQNELGRTGGTVRDVVPVVARGLERAARGSAP